MTQSNFPVKSYCRLNFVRASIFNFEGLDILRDSIENPSSKFLSFEFSTSFRFKFRASRYINGLNRTSELTYFSLIFLRASVFNYERLDILWDTIGHPSEMLLSFEFEPYLIFIRYLLTNTFIP